MMDDYKDFRCFSLLDDGEKEEIEVEQEKIEELFDTDKVFLLVRYDLRRLFIWKGPRAPVRKRFISSRVGAQLQQESAKVAMHLKIVSVDAGDEPVEFLRVFKLDPYEVDEQEKIEDMYYIRNDERRKIEEAEIAAKIKAKKGKKKKEYWSPVLEEEKRLEQMQKAKAKAISTKAKAPVKASKKSVAKPKTSTSTSRQTQPPRKKFAEHIPSMDTLTKDAEKLVLKEILKADCPKGFKRLNIVVESSLYGPKKVTSELFGKKIEEIEWDRIKKIPEGSFDIESGQLRIRAKNNKIQGIEIFTKSTNTKEKTGKNTAKKSTKRKLNTIPTG
ncbi:hypothetical protein DSAG12_02979 [Promethearchaeum syntrophicum]|uniref:Gelsolin-like domain-containing protein n=1 Tax=Promethearchaeum syntrophicum TaxID=2594042 RepID=A0A5B9DE80_9ARCH